MEETRFDVIIVGCGVAGLSAAVSAAENGARVAILERATLEERGGQTRYTEAYFRMKSEHEVSDDFELHLAENSGGHQDPSLVDAMSGDRAHWPRLPQVAQHQRSQPVSRRSPRAPGRRCSG